MDELMLELLNEPDVMMKRLGIVVYEVPEQGDDNGQEFSDSLED
jgi:hypothetical protein